MNYKEFQDILENKISEATEENLIKFSLHICKELKEDYLSFSRLTGFGNCSIIEQGIKVIESENTSFEKIENLIQELENVCPDADDYSVIEVSYALNATTAIIDTLRYLQTKDIEYIRNVSTYILDTLDFKVHETEGEMSEEDIDSHSLIQMERTRQLKELSNGL